MLDPKWNQWKPAFFYGIAHVLRHAARKGALDLQLLISENKNTAKVKPSLNWSKQNLRKSATSLLRLVGWADEFYWLGIWRLTGKLRAGPYLEAISSESDLLLLALLGSEWGGMLQEAHLYWRQMLIQNNVDFEDFQVWDRKPEPTLESALIQRAQKRLETADLAITELRGRFNNDSADPAMNHCLDNIQRNLCISKARNQYALCQLTGKQGAAAKEITLGFLNGAKKLSVTTEDSDFIGLLVEAVMAGGEPFSGSISKEGKTDFDRLHILAGWIIDLLGGDQRDAKHPRASFSKKELPKNADATMFPNAEQIRRLEKLLDGHLDWLRFASEQKGFESKLKEIELEEKNFRKKIFANNEAGSQASPSYAWELFVLRDWASYTPLVPRSDDTQEGDGAGEVVPDAGGMASQPYCSQQISSFGGGYFLRVGSAGIAIDPGYDFIENLYYANLSIATITDVIVTHDHYDHIASFGPLLSLIREHRRELLKDSPRASVLPKVKFFLSRGAYSQYAHAIVDLGHYEGVEIITDWDHVLKHSHRLSDNKTRLYTTHAEHGSVSGFGRGVGLKFVFGDGVPVLGITSDTGWYSEYVLEGREAKGGSLAREFYARTGGEPDVLILHVGSLKRSELRDSGFYKTHLGARGVFLTIDAIKKCRLAILGEFGEECRGHRAWFADRVSNFIRSSARGRRNFRCIPSDRRTYICARGNRIFVRTSPPSCRLVSYGNVKVSEGKGGKNLKFA